MPQRDIVRIHASSGTTGKPTVVGYTKNDIANWAEAIARIVTAAGATSDDHCTDMLRLRNVHRRPRTALTALKKIGASVVPTSSGNTQKQLMFMRDFGTTALVATPSYALYLSESAKELEFPMSDYHLSLGLLGSEGCTPEMRDQIEKNWGMFVTDNYGMSELMGPGLSGECRERVGQHINEDMFLFEVIDRDTLEPIGEGPNGRNRRHHPHKGGNSAAALPHQGHFGNYIRALQMRPNHRANGQGQGQKRRYA